MAVKFPVVRKEWTTAIRAHHDLRGITTHPDAMAGIHGHRWTITLIWVAEFNCKIGFQRDEHNIEKGWGARLEALEGKNLSELIPLLPATAENFACWLLFFWLPRGEKDINYEIQGVRVTKDGHSAEVMRTEANRRGWEWFGGEVV